MPSVVDAARYVIKQDGRVTTRGENRAIRRAMFNPIQRPAKKATRPRNMRKSEFVAMLSTEEGRTEIDNRVDLGNPMPRIVQGMKALQQQILFWEEMLREVGNRSESREVQERSRELYRTAIKKARKELGEEWEFANAWGLQGYMASVVIDLTRDSPEVDNRGLEEALFGAPNPAPSSSHHTRFQSPLYSPEPQPELPVDFPRIHADGSIPRP